MKYIYISHFFRVFRFLVAIPFHNLFYNLIHNSCSSNYSQYHIFSVYTVVFSHTTYATHIYLVSHLSDDDRKIETSQLIHWNQILRVVIPASCKINYFLTFFPKISEDLFRGALDLGPNLISAQIWYLPITLSRLKFYLRPNMISI